MEEGVKSFPPFLLKKKIMEISIDKIHEAYFKDNRSDDDELIVWIAQAVGLAETGACSWDKEKLPVVITTNLPLKRVDYKINYLEKYCQKRNIPFIRKAKFTFTIIGTAFTVIRDYDSFEYKYLWQNSGLEIDPEKFTEDYFDQLTAETIEQSSVLGRPKTVKTGLENSNLEGWLKLKKSKKKTF